MFKLGVDGWIRVYWVDQVWKTTVDRGNSNVGKWCCPLEATLTSIQLVQGPWGRFQPRCMWRGEQQLKFTEHLICAMCQTKEMLYLYCLYWTNVPIPQGPEKWQDWLNEDGRAGIWTQTKPDSRVTFLTKRFLPCLPQKSHGGTANPPALLSSLLRGLPGATRPPGGTQVSKEGNRVELERQSRWATKHCCRALWGDSRKHQLLQPASPLISSESGCCSRVPGEPKVWAEGFLEKSSLLAASQWSPRVTSDTPPQHWLTSGFKGLKSVALPSFHTDVTHPQETLSPCIVRAILVQGSQSHSESKKEIKGRGGKEQLWQNEKEVVFV